MLQEDIRAAERSWAVSSAADRAAMDFFAHMKVELPCPKRFAAHMLEEHIAVLQEAWETPEGWRVKREYARPFQCMGLVGCGGPYLTAFGHTVRKIVMEAWRL
jgi:hypothetical protein